ncbi:MAG: ATP-grasp domain-containing protein [Spirochaeta sp.]
MRASLCAEYNVAGPNLRGVIACEHKFWSRLEQSKAIDECPQFEAVDIFDEQAADKISIEYPFWLKPIKATSSQLGFKIQNKEDFLNAQQQIQNGIQFYSENFNYFLHKVPLPEEVKNIDGRYCIAESIIAGHQCTVSGYVHNRKVTVYGIVDSINYPESSSFFRFEYPSVLPEHVQDRITDASIRIIEQIGLDNSTFNIEFYYDETYDRLWALEVNPRLSQSHSYQYRMVDGDTNLKIMIDLSLNTSPDFPYRQGKYARAAKFFYRIFDDGLVTRVPDAKKIAEIEQAIPDTRVDIKVSEGVKLSELSLQDSYSYDLAHIFIAAADRDELLQKYHRCLEMMNIQIEEV